MNLTADEVNKMKVVELRAELQVRGLDPKGVKAVLVDRLIAALGQDGILPSVGNGSSQMSLDLSAGDLDESKIEDENDGSQDETSQIQETIEESTIVEDKPTVVPNQSTEKEQDEDIEDETEVLRDEDGDEDAEMADGDQEAEAAAIAEDISEQKMETDADADGADPDADADGADPDAEAVVADPDAEGDNTKRKIEVINGDVTEESKTKKPRTDDAIVFKNVPLNEPEFDDNDVLLDWYKSDLNLKISTENFLDAEPTVYEDFPFAYAGVKATYGFKSGKVCFEAKWAKSCEVRSDFGDKETKHVFRVGWSDTSADLQLGEDKFSYGYDVSGKLYNAGEIQDLGESLVEGDVITSYIDLESDPVEIKFAKNGTVIGEPLKVAKTELENRALFPHVLVRNVKFEVNFGSKDVAHDVDAGYVMVGKVENQESRCRGPTKPENKEDCQLIMLVGLACSGKTKWAKDFIKENPENHYNVLGTSTAVERALKDQSILSSQKAPRVFDSFFMKAGKFVERLVDIAPSRKRNYILDQSNVLPSVQRRKCGGFENFRRRAVVILPPDEEYQKRIKSKEQEQGKSVPKSTILDMKASFRLPDVGELFSEVEFPELQREQAQELVTKYNKEGVTAGYGRSPSGRGGRGMPRGRGAMRGRGGPRGGHGGRPWRGGPLQRGHMGGYGMRRGGPAPMRMPRGPHMNMGGPPRGGRGMGGPPMRGSMRGSSGPPPQRGNLQPRGGTWARGGNNLNSSRGPPRGGRGVGRGSSQMHSGGSGRWGSGPGPQRPNNGGRAPQGGNFQSWGQGNWGGGRNMGNPGFGGGFGAADPWVHQQVPDQGFGQSWDSVGGNNGNRGGTWQSYGGQTIGNAGRR